MSLYEQYKREKFMRAARNWVLDHIEQLIIDHTREPHHYDAEYIAASLNLPRVYWGRVEQALKDYDDALLHMPMVRLSRINETDEFNRLFEEFYNLIIEVNEVEEMRAAGHPDL